MSICLLFPSLYNQQQLKSHAVCSCCFKKFELGCTRSEGVHTEESLELAERESQRSRRRNVTSQPPRLRRRNKFQQRPRSTGELPVYSKPRILKRQLASASMIREETDSGESGATVSEDYVPPAIAPIPIKYKRCEPCDGGHRERLVPKLNPPAVIEDARDAPTTMISKNSMSRLGQCTYCMSYYCYLCAVDNITEVCSCRNLVYFTCQACQASQVLSIIEAQEELIGKVHQVGARYRVFNGCFSCVRVTLVTPFNIDSNKFTLDIFGSDITPYYTRFSNV